IDENAHDGIGDPGGIGWFHENAGVSREILVTCQSAEAEPEPNSRLEAKSILHRHRLEADIVSILQRRDGARAVKGDIELARQAVKRAVVENVEVPFARERARVDEFLRIDSGRGRAGNVANIVRARTARTEPKILDTLDHRDGIACGNFADLQVGARRDVRITAAEALGEICDAGELCRLED